MIHPFPSKDRDEYPEPQRSGEVVPGGTAVPGKVTETGEFPRKWNLANVYAGIDAQDFLVDLEHTESQIAPLMERAGALMTAGGGSDEGGSGIGVFSTADRKAGGNTETGTQTAAAWEGFLKDWESHGLLLNQLRVYVNCLASTDTTNETYLVLLGKLSELSERSAPVRITLARKLAEFDTEAYAALLAGSQYLAEIAFALDEMREDTVHIMDEAREKLAARLSVDGIHAWGRLYTKLSGKLTVQAMENGTIVRKSVGQVKFDDAEPSVRKFNFHSANDGWRGIADSCAAAINHIAGTRLTLYREQGYAHFIDKPLFDNRLDRDALDAMWKSVSDRKAMLVPYLEAKARLLGLDRLSWYDQSAPMEEGKIDFDEAARTVIERFGAFDPRMGDFARHALASGFVESEDRSGKRPGAYCTKFARRKEPRVFLTFNGTYDAMSTLAHELGHAYHGFLLKDRPYPLQSYVMSTAETASTFAEQIITDYLIERAPTPRAKLAMLDRECADAVVFLMNIHARYLFEYAFYTARTKGEVRPDELEAMMVDAQRTAFLDRLAEWDPMFWASKLHFFISGLSFYNFPYTFGYLFSTALYRTAKEEGPSFARTYEEVLLATGCMKTKDVIASTMGMDIAEPAFWNRSLDLIEERVRRFTELAAAVRD